MKFFLKTYAFRRSCFTLLYIILISTALGGCTKYWWTRGQTPSIDTLLNRSQSTLHSELNKRGAIRTKLSPIAKSLEKNLLTSLTLIRTSNTTPSPKLEKALKACRSDFIALDGKLSIGSRAPYGELSNQLRMFITQAKGNQPLRYPSFGLFTSRTISFLANELSVPAPIFS